MDKAHTGKGVMSESNTDVTDEGKKEHKGEEGESRIISGTMDIEHKGKGVMSESNSDVSCPEISRHI